VFLNFSAYTVGLVESESEFKFSGRDKCNLLGNFRII